MGEVRIADKRKSLAVSLLLNAGVMLLFRFCMVPVFETNDDMAIMGIVNGTRGKLDIHAIQHFLLGLLYKSLYSITCSVSWYSVCQYLFLMLAFSAVCYVLIRRAGTHAGIGIWLVITSFFAPQCYGMMQYTKAAGILTCSGIFMLFHSVAGDDTKKISPAECAAGFILALTGSMYRYDEFLSSGMLMTGIGVYLLLLLCGEEKSAVFKKIMHYVLVFGALFLTAFLLKKADTSFYSSDERWSYYREYNDLRAQLQDYGFPDYEMNREAYEALGINEDAYDLYSGWNQFDPDKLDAETMRSLIALKEERKFTGQVVKDYFREMPSFFMNNRMCRCFLMMLAVLLFVVYRGRKKHRWKVFAAAAWQFLLFGMLYLYLFYKGRYTMDRIAVGYWFAMILFASWIITEFSFAFRTEEGQRALLILGGIAFGFYSSYWLDALPSSRRDVLKIRENQRRILTEMSQDKEHLYLRKAGLLVNDQCFGPFDAQDFGFQDNLGLLGGWICSVPVQLDVLEKYGVRNPYRDMIDNDRVLLVDNHIEETLRYLQAYYAPDVKAEEVRKYGQIRVYRIVTEGA